MYVVQYKVLFCKLHFQWWLVKMLILARLYSTSMLHGAADGHNTTKEALLVR